MFLSDRIEKWRCPAKRVGVGPYQQAVLEIGEAYDRLGKLHPDGTPQEEYTRQINAEIEAMGLILCMGNDPTIHLLTKQAALLVNQARANVEVMDHLKDLQRPSCLVAKNGYLYKTVRELGTFYDPDRDSYHVLETADVGGILSIQYGFCLTDALSEVADDDLAIDADSVKMYQEMGIDLKASNVQDMIIDALKYLLKFRLLLASEKTPIEATPSTKVGGRLPKGIATTHPGYRAVSLTKEYQIRKKEMEATKRELVKEGKHLALVEISGFLRDQPYGPGRTERKTIWIDGFESHRWRLEGPRKVMVKE